MAAIFTFIMICADPEKLSTPQKDAYLGDIENLITLEVIEGEHNSYLQDEFLDDYYDGYSNFVPFMPLHYELDEDTYTKENDDTDLTLDVEYIRAYLNFPLNMISKKMGEAL